MKTLGDIREMIQTTTAGDTDRILDICNDIVNYIQNDQLTTDARLIHLEIMAGLDPSAGRGNNNDT